MSKPLTLEYGPSRPLVVTQWARELADEVGSDMRTVIELDDIQRDLTVIATALQKAYDLGASQSAPQK